MVSIPKIVGVMSCGFLLGLGLSLNGIHTIKGEVVRVEPSSYFVKQYDGYLVFAGPVAIGIWATWYTLPS